MTPGTPHGSDSRPSATGAVLGFETRYGPWALVAGGARGIGRAFCDALAQRGLHLVVVDVLADELATQAGRLRAYGVEVETAAVDLAADDAASRVVAACGAREVGLLVYCAAQIPSGRFLDLGSEIQARAVAVNARTPLLLTHALAGRMRERRRGGIVLVSSMAALQGTGWVATYAATKAFEMILAESLWWELKDDGVDVLALLPGATDTEGLRAASPHVPDPSALARPDDVAGEALEALGTAPSWICGEPNRAIAEAVKALPRTEVIEMMSNATRTMAEGPRRSR
jgi:short-subunit dehydrogenase